VSKASESPISPKSSSAGPNRDSSKAKLDMVASGAAAAQGETSRSDSGTGGGDGNRDAGDIWRSAAIAASSCASSMSPKFGSSGIRKMLPRAGILTGGTFATALAGARAELPHGCWLQLTSRLSVIR
jgi:hypothetical protein